MLLVLYRRNREKNMGFLVEFSAGNEEMRVFEMLMAGGLLD